jgi:carbohydrate-binding DOMON domain-containing protein
MCIRVIGYLRRLEVYPEPELRLLFLQSKDSYLQSQLADIQESNPSEYLKKYIDISRVSIFDILTQYKAIFFDSSSSIAPTSTSNLNLTSSASKSLSVFLSTSDTIATSSILASYIAYTVEKFQSELKINLALIWDVVC